jgi:uncharacterized protein YhfF
MIIFSSVVDEAWMDKDDTHQANELRTLIIQGEMEVAVPFVLAEQSRDLLLNNG